MFKLYMFYCTLVIILISIIGVLTYQIYKQKKMIDKLIEKFLDLDYTHDIRTVICYKISKAKCDSYGDAYCDKCIYEYIKSEVENGL